MKRLLKSVSVVALGFAMANAVQAGDDKYYDEKDLKKMIEDQGIYVETAKKGIVLSGYVDTSYTYQFAGNVGSSSVPGLGPDAVQGQAGEGGNTSAVPSSEAQYRAFDTDNNDFNINAFKLALEKALPDENTWAAGFRADLMFGEDAQLLGGSQVAGDSASYLFLEQAYVQFRVPVGNGLDFKFGKFVTLLGYEVIESPANLNFSRSFLFQNAIPLTHTGVLMSYAFNDIVDVQFGLVNGWNNSDSGMGINGTGINQIPAVTGQVAVHAPGGNATIANSFIYSAGGEAQTAGNFAENESVFTWDIWGQWAPRFANDKLLLAFNADLGFADNAGTDDAYGLYLNGALPPGLGDGTGYNTTTSTWWGAALYAKYQFTPMFSLATRGEYFHDDHGYKLGVSNPYNIGAGNVSRSDSTGVDLWSWTVTANFDIWENLLFRLEYRYDLIQDGSNTVFDSGGLPVFDYGENDDQHQIAVNLVYTF